MIRRFIINGHSMEPYLRNGDHVLVSKFFSPRKGDVVAAVLDGRMMIKRITAVSNDKFFIAGDNKQDSLDSRKLGPVSREDILGKVMMKY